MRWSFITVVLCTFITASAAPRDDVGHAIDDLTNLERRLEDVERRLLNYEGPPPQTALDQARRVIADLDEQLRAEQAELDELEIVARAAIPEVRLAQTQLDDTERQITAKLMGDPKMVAASEALSEAETAADQREKTVFAETTDAELQRLTEALLDARREELRNGGANERAEVLNAQQAFEKCQAELLAADPTYADLAAEVERLSGALADLRAGLSTKLAGDLELEELRTALDEAKSTSVAAADEVKAAQTRVNEITERRTTAIRHAEQLVRQAQQADRIITELRNDIGEVRTEMNRARDALRAALRELDRQPDE